MPLEPAYIPVADQTMRGHVRERQQGWAAAARELQATFAASPPATPEPGRRYVTAEEACADLGLEPAHRKAAEAGLRSLVSEQATGFSVMKDLRAQGMRAPLVKELLVRGIRMVAEARSAKGVHDLYVRKAGPPPGAGWAAIPAGKRGGFRRPKSGGGYEYAYPGEGGGYTQHDNPAADESVRVHEEHENGTPEPKVRVRMEALEAKAKAAGLNFTGKATARTTMKHLNELEKQLDKAIAQKHQREKEPAGKAPADADVDATPHPGQKKPRDGEPVVVREKGPEEPGFAIPPKPSTEGDNAGKPAADEVPGVPGKAQEEGRGASSSPEAARVAKLGAAKGIDPAKVKQLLDDPDFQTDEGRKALTDHLESLPDLVDDLPDEVPADEGERKKLKAHAATLEATVGRMEKALAIERETHKKEMAALRDEVKKLVERPTPRQAQKATNDLVVAALLIFGFAAGFLFAGPMGALLGGSMANQFIKTGVAKSLSRTRAPGLYVVGDELVLIKAEHDAHARTVRENDPGRIVAARAAIVGELKGAPTGSFDDPREVLAALDQHSPTWARVSAYLSPDNRRKLLAAATAVLQAEPPKPEEPAPPAEPAVAEPPPRIRGRHGENAHGHRDDLLPGQTLTVRKGTPGPRTVTVLDDGVFQWGDNTYPNGSQLLKALTGNDDHRLTVRRYFALGAENARIAKAMADALRVKCPDLLVSAYQGRVRAEGALARYNIPTDHASDTAVVLDVDTVQTLLTETRA